MEPFIVGIDITSTKDLFGRNREIETLISCAKRKGNAGIIGEMLKEAEVLLEGHFLLTSGRHSDKYMQCAKIFQYAKYSEPLCKELADQYKNDNIELVIGPAIGAIQMSYEVGKQLGVKNIFAERENGEMTLRRGFTIEEGQRVLVVEDVVTTGGSVREVIDLVKARKENVGGEVLCYVW